MGIQVHDERSPLTARVDHSLIDSALFDCYELATYLVLARHANFTSKEGFPSHSRLCKLLNCSKPRLIKSIESLEEKGAIRVDRTDGEVNRYVLTTFTPPSKPDLHPPVNDVDTKDIKSKKDTPKETTTAPPDAGQNSNGHNATTPDTTPPLQKVPVEPKTAHQKLFEYVANTWFKAYKYSDGSYYYVINGEFAMVSSGKIGAMMKRLKRRFGDKVKPDDLKPFVSFFERRCANSFLPATDFTLLKWINEWKEEKRRFDPHHDMYADLIGKPERK